MGKSPLQSLEKLSIFLVLALSFHLFLPRICQDHLLNNYIFEIDKDRSISSESLKTQDAFEIGCFLLQ